jgi:hypothetical protein
MPTAANLLDFCESPEFAHVLASGSTSVLLEVKLLGNRRRFYFRSIFGQDTPTLLRGLRLVAYATPHGHADFIAREGHILVPLAADSHHR